MPQQLRIRIHFGNGNFYRSINRIGNFERMAMGLLSMHMLEIAMISILRKYFVLMIEAKMTSLWQGYCYQKESCQWYVRCHWLCTDCLDLVLYMLNLFYTHQRMFECLCQRFVHVLRNRYHDWNQMYHTGREYYSHVKDPNECKLEYHQIGFQRHDLNIRYHQFFKSA